MEESKKMEDLKELKVVITQMHWDNFGRRKEGDIITLKPKQGFKKDALGKLVEHTFSVKEQFDPGCMKEYKGRKVEVKVDADFDPEAEEVIIVPKKGGKASRLKAQAEEKLQSPSEQEVI